MIRSVFSLGFDPTRPPKELREVCADDLALTIWAIIKGSHITSQFFNELVLIYTKEIRQKINEGTLTAKTLLNILSGVGRSPVEGLIGSSELEFAKELLPYALGKKTLIFQIPAR